MLPDLDGFIDIRLLPTDCRPTMTLIVAHAFSHFSPWTAVIAGTSIAAVLSFEVDEAAVSIAVLSSSIAWLLTIGQTPAIICTDWASMIHAGLIGRSFQL